MSVIRIGTPSFHNGYCRKAVYPQHIDTFDFMLFAINVQFFYYADKSCKINVNKAFTDFLKVIIPSNRNLNFIAPNKGAPSRNFTIF